MEVFAWRDNWEPDATHGGLPVRDRLSLPITVATMLGVEQAALAAAFAAVHAPGRSIHVLPCDNGTHVIRLALAALTKVAPELGLRVPDVGDEVIVESRAISRRSAGLADRRGRFCARTGSTGRSRE